MDNENTVQTEQAETTETSMAFDDGWNDEEPTVMGDGSDDGWGDDEEDRETGSESEETEADADQQEAEGTDGEAADGAETEEEAEGDKDKPDQAETYELRYLGETRTVDRDEVVKLAQQGMDYQRIREKWDAVKDDVPKLRMYEGFLKELADARGGDIESLIDETRTRSLIAQAEAKGERLSASAAAAQAVQARMKAMEPAEAQKQADADEEAQKARQASVDRFLSIYGAVKPEDIPETVWAEADRVGDLTIAYQHYLGEKQESELKKLRDELEQVKQQQKNRERSMGSSKSVGAAAAKDSFMEGWDDL